MRIERINENSICCTLTSFDLSVRNLNLRELAYGSEKAKKLFEELMSKASSEVGFNADNTPLMIEAIPLSSDSIKFIISKVTDPEELDARFSRFTQNPQSQRRDSDSWLSKLTAALLEGAEGIAGELKKLDAAKSSASSGSSGSGSKVIALTSSQAEDAPSSDDKKSGDDVAKDDAPLYDFRAFVFDDLGIAISAAKAALNYSGESTLYKDHRDSRYVLAIMSKGAASEDFSRACNVVAEYGRMLKTVQNSLSYYEEHYITVIKDDAIAKLAGI